MLNVTVRPDDNVLLYDASTRKLLGAITYMDNSASACLQFRLSEKVLVMREALVLGVTDYTSVCPQELADRFGKAS